MLRPCPSKRQPTKRAERQVISDKGPEGRVSLGSEYRRACAASAPRRSPRTLAGGGRPRPATSRQLRASQGHPSLRPQELRGLVKINLWKLRDFDRMGG